MSNLKITQCKGEGQGSCKMCADNGKWNRNWMCFLFKIEGYEGCYCSECVKKIMEDEQAAQFADASLAPCQEAVRSADRHLHNKKARKNNG